MKQLVQEYNNSYDLDQILEDRKTTGGETMKDIGGGERNKMQNYCICNSVSLAIGVLTLDSDD